MKDSKSKNGIGIFLVLDPPTALAVERAAKRCAEQYSAMGKNVDEWFGMLEVNSASFQDCEPEVEGGGGRTGPKERRRRAGLGLFN